LTINQIPSHNHSSALPSGTTSLRAFNSYAYGNVSTYGFLMGGPGLKSEQIAIGEYKVPTQYNVASSTTSSTTGDAGG
jgi:hypothetical protein